MQCPSCKDVSLVNAEREAIEIDYCPNCHGIWLDRGELDKIIERSVSDAMGPGAAHREQHVQKPHKQKRNLITELFDF
ncbi:hypothetical protein AWR36_012645 [Microbulbifer flavimaris]|uniref:Transcription factor zinc-finger domain-containing protein n=1 Tax=Microbulbifer flavimaris TaxID=1781068 RepID=A0ABX4HY51_9GAMM|nr:MULTISPECIES: zf-TFIIB domain-containing protein [Microbulbifer]KUJ82625.1 hypothetical protein AVO43_12610 [Microbulbifer sp. ZGT114]PCO04836.1 hypothetical protein AWR36_012645 [Microbulbifer flavimaris]